MSRNRNKNLKTAAPPDSAGVFPGYRIQWLSKLTYGEKFEFFIVGVILLNAAALAALTLRNTDESVRDVLLLIDDVALWVFVVELGLRILSYGSKPWMFFRSGWNVFDFLVIGLTPFFQGQTVVLRLLRLLRVIRIFRFLPEVRILTSSIIKSVPPLASLTVLIGFMLFLYAMTGHYLFGPEAPENWGDVGVAMQSLIVLLTLENFPDLFLEGMSITPFALIYYLSFVFVIVFTVLNILIGIVLNAMDQAREEDNTKTQQLRVINTIDEDLEGLGSSNPNLSADIDRLQAELALIRKRISQSG